MSFKPDGYTSVAPYLIVDDATTTLAFLKSVFGCEPLRLFHREDGTIQHTEVRIDDTVVMLGQMPGGPDTHVHIYVRDADKTFERAVDANGIIVQEVEQKEDGDRRGAVRDPSGTTWWFATETADSSRA